jgi:TetR/AcrR family transcriptional regulator
VTRLATAETRRAPGKTRMRIIEAARDLMIEHDHLEISIAEITERAEANIAAVSYHFGGREGLMVSIARADADELIADMDRLLAAPMTPDQKLRAHIVGVVRAYQKRPYLHRLLHKLLREGSSETAALVGEFFVMPVYNARRAILQDGMDQGIFRTVDPWLVAHAFEGACAQIFTSAASRAVVLGIDRLDAEVVESFGRSTADLVVRGVLSDGHHRQS